jgi:hypothetical protein
MGNKRIKAHPMPSKNRLRLHDLSQIEQFRASPRHPDHQGAIEAAQAGPRWRSPHGNPKLMPKEKVSAGPENLYRAMSEISA